MVSRTDLLRIEHRAHLIEVGDLQIRAQAHAAAVRRLKSKQYANERRLADAIASDEADAVAAHDAQREVLDDLALAEALADSVKLDNQSSGALAGIQIQIDTAEAVSPLRALNTQSLEPAHAALIPRPSRLDPFANPDLLLCQLLVEALLRGAFRIELRTLELLVAGEIAGIRAQPSTIELHDACHGTVQERAVVGNDDGGRDAHEQCLESLDRLDVQMIGRLIEQQHVGLRGKGGCQRGTLALTAGGQIGYAFAGNLEPLEILRHLGRRVDLLALIRGGAPSARRALAQQGLAQGGCVREHGLLLDECDAQPVTALDLAFIEGKLAGEQPEQGRFAGAVAADESDALAGLQSQIGVIEQRLPAEREASATQRDERHARAVRSRN